MEEAEVKSTAVKGVSARLAEAMPCMTGRDRNGRAATDLKDEGSGDMLELIDHGCRRGSPSSASRDSGI